MNPENKAALKDALGGVREALRKACEEHPEGATPHEVAAAGGGHYAPVFYSLKALVKLGEVECKSVHRWLPKRNKHRKRNVYRFVETGDV